MTPPVLLTAPTPPLSADCPKHNVALPPFGVLLAHQPRAGPSSTSTTPSTTTALFPPTTTTSASDSAYECGDASGTWTNRTAAVPTPLRPWTGTPIRAMAPLPRRGKRHILHSGAQPEASWSAGTTLNVLASTTAVGAPPPRGPCPRRRVARFRRNAIDSDSDSDSDSVDGGGIETGDRDGEDDGDVHAPSGSRYYSYESITAAEGLAAWSFEELRIECYAQSLVARGTKPPLVDQPSLAIPPAFVPRVVRRN